MRSARRSLEMLITAADNRRSLRATSTARAAVALSCALAALVPASAHSGRIQVLLAHGRHSASYGPIAIFRHALHPPVVYRVPAPITGGTTGTAFEGQGMWIWYVSRSSAGEVAAIAARAHASG